MSYMDNPLKLPPLRYKQVSLPNGNETTFEQMREEVLKSNLYQQGDTILVWINEGDLIMHNLLGSRD